jgi:hypothetical protein
MNCEYALLRNNACFSEELLLQAINNGEDTGLAKQPWSGRVTLQDGATTLCLEDELSALFYNLCIALTEAMQTGRASYRYFEVHGKIAIEIRDEILSFGGDFVTGNPMFLVEETLPALFACTQRYMALLALSARLVPNLEGEMEELQKPLRRAMAVFDARFTNAS